MRSEVLKGVHHVTVIQGLDGFGELLDVEASPVAACGNRGIGMPEELDRHHLEHTRSGEGLTEAVP